MGVGTIKTPTPNHPTTTRRHRTYSYFRRSNGGRWSGKRETSALTKQADARLMVEVWGERGEKLGGIWSQPITRLIQAQFERLSKAKAVPTRERLNKRGPPLSRPGYGYDWLSNKTRAQSFVNDVTRCHANDVILLCKSTPLLQNPRGT